jgi:nitrilase
MPVLPLAVVQYPPVFLNLAASMARADWLIRDAVGSGARIVVFPEAWLPGYPVWLDEAPGAALWDYPPAAALFRRLFENAAAIDGPEIAQLGALAVELGVEIVMGFHERRGSSLYNSVIRIAADGTRNIHRKIMPTYNERMIWAAADGGTLRAWNTPYGPMGTLICWEHWMPLARAAMHAAHEAVHFALWPGLMEIQQLNSRHYAFEGQCFVVGAGCVIRRQDVIDGFDSLPGDAVARSMLEAIPTEREVLKPGGSAVIGPDSNYVAGPAGATLETLHATIEIGRLSEGRLKLDTTGHYSRPDIFSLRVDRRRRDGTRFIDDPELPYAYEHERHTDEGPRHTG